MKAIVGVALALCLGLVVVGCTASDAGQPTSPPTDLDLARAATAAALRAPSGQDAQVSGTWFVSRSGTVLSSNTGHACRSGRVLRVTVAGTFPHIVVTGGPGLPTHVTAILLTVDAQTGETCEMGAGTGPQRPAPGATQFMVDVSGQPSS